MAQINREKAPLLSTSNAYATIKTSNDGGSQTIVFSGDDEREYPLSYLTIEGIFVHAQRTPDALCLRIPRLENTGEYVDVSYSRAATIVEWLSNSLCDVLRSRKIEPGPGVVITLLTLPYAHSFFHALALFQLGCAVQYFNHKLGQEAMDTLLGPQREAKSCALFYAGLSGEEIQSLKITTLKDRIGVDPIPLEEKHFAIRQVETVPIMKPRLPRTEEAFYSQVSEEQILTMIHTSGSTGIPKLVRYDILAFSLLVKLPPQTQNGQDGFLPPFFNASRAYWASSVLLALQSVINGCPVAYCYPEDRLYPTIKETITAIAATKSMGVFLYASQAAELYDLLENNVEYRRLATNLKIVIFAGAGIDQHNSDIINSISLPILFGNLHGLSEVGSTGLISTQAPYNSFQSIFPYQLWQPVEGFSDDKDGESSPRLVKLWICLDTHPVAWWLAFKKLTPINIQRFPVLGPFHNRPVLDTGDIFEQRQINTSSGQVEMRYIFHSRSDDQIRLSNLFRPNVNLLETFLLQRLTLPGRLCHEAIDAIQLCGDQKPKLALVIQVIGKLIIDKVKFPQVIQAAMNDLDSQLPKEVRFQGLKRVKIVILDSNMSSSDPVKLENTHKGTLCRLYNLKAIGSWLDSLDYE